MTGFVLADLVSAADHLLTLERGWHYMGNYEKTFIEVDILQIVHLQWVHLQVVKKPLFKKSYREAVSCTVAAG